MNFFSGGDALSQTKDHNSSKYVHTQHFLIVFYTYLSTDPLWEPRTWLCDDCIERFLLIFDGVGESLAHYRLCICIDINGWFQVQRNNHEAFHSPIKPHKTAPFTETSNTNTQKGFVNPIEETLEKLVPGYFATLADLPTQNCQSIKTRASLFPESCTNGKAQLRLQPKNGVSRTENDLGWMDAFCPHKLINRHIF